MTRPLFFPRAWLYVRENVHVACALVTLASCVAALSLHANAATLPPADVARYEATCTAHVAFQTLTATLIDESSGDPLALHDDNADQEIHPRDYATAWRIASERIANDERIHGRGVDVGIAQINSHNFAAQHTTLAQMFDPCENLRVSSRMLYAAWKQTHNVDATLQVYNSGSPTGDAGYVARVRAAARTPYALLVLGPLPTRPQPAPRGSTSLDAPSRTSAHFYTEDAP